MRKILSKIFWSHGTPLGYMGPLFQRDVRLGAWYLQIPFIWGPVDPPGLVAPQVNAKTLKSVGSWCGPQLCVTQRLFFWKGHHRWLEWNPVKRKTTTKVATRGCFRTLRTVQKIMWEKIFGRGLENRASIDPKGLGTKIFGPKIFWYKPRMMCIYEIFSFII